MTFPQWRIQPRLYTALALLADHMPVTTAVAHHCGWASASALVMGASSLPALIRTLEDYLRWRTRTSAIPPCWPANAENAQGSAASANDARADPARHGERMSSRH